MNMRMIFKSLAITSVAGSLVLSAGCTGVNGVTKSDKRATVDKMRSDTLTALFKEKPVSKSQLNKASGYAVFSNANVNVIFASFSGGYGVAHNNKTGKDTYMKMSGGGIGLGIGTKDYRIVFLFTTPEAYKNFVDHGWVFGAQADAAAKADSKGGAASGETDIGNMKTYVMTKTGLALQATIQGTKYWQSDELH